MCCPFTGSESVWRHTQRGGHLAPCECASVPSAKGRSSSPLLLGLCYVSCSPAAPEEAQLCTKLPCSPRCISTAAPLFLVFLSRKRAQTRTRALLERQGSLSESFQLGQHTHTHTCLHSAILSPLRTQLYLKILQTPFIISYSRI